jgi:rubredoxin-NAD+ reductase
LIIIGSGHAAFALAGAFRKLDAARELVLVTEDGGDACNKPALSNALALGKSFADLLNGTHAVMAERLGAIIMRNTRVEQIDTARRQIHTADARLPYGDLVLAVGAEPVRLEIDGDGAADVSSVNTLDDYVAFRGRIDGMRRVLVMGAGLIGCEFASDLLHAGITSVVVDPAGFPLASLVPPVIGDGLRHALARQGVQWHLGTTVIRIDKTDAGYRVRLADDTVHDVDAVLSAVGLRPRTRLAAAAGIDVERGIRVDETGRTSVPHVYALGDCAQFADGRWLPHIRPILVASRAMAATLSGTPTPIVFPVMPVMVKTPAYPVVMARPPAAIEGQWHEERRDDGVRLLFRDADGALQGFAVAGAMGDEHKELAKALGSTALAA